MITVEDMWIQNRQFTLNGLCRMEFEAGGHVMHAWKQAVGLGNPSDMRHIRRQLGVHEVCRSSWTKS